MDQDDENESAEAAQQLAKKADLVREFWREVYRVLKNGHNFSASRALEAVELCRAEVEGPRVGDALYNFGAYRVADLAARLIRG